MSNKRVCCVPGCDYCSVLHTFPHPVRDSERFKKWVTAVGGEVMELDGNYVFRNRRVCQNHFSEFYICRSNRLSNIAVPTLNLAKYAPMSTSSGAQGGYGVMGRGSPLRSPRRLRNKHTVLKSEINKLEVKEYAPMSTSSEAQGGYGVMRRGTPLRTYPRRIRNKHTVLKSEINKLEVKGEVTEQLNATVKQEINPKVTEQLNATVKQEIKSEVTEQLNATVKQEIKSEVTEQLNATVKQEIKSELAYDWTVETGLYLEDIKDEVVEQMKPNSAELYVGYDVVAKMVLDPVVLQQAEDEPTSQAYRTRP